MRTSRLAISEPVSLLKQIPIQDNGEPLVDFLEYCPELVISPPYFTYRRERSARLGLAQRLCQANLNLPKGLKLTILECWRAPHIQRRMYQATYKKFRDLNPDWSESKLVRVAEQFSAPESEVVPPPHSTGGAVDLGLIGADGEPLDMVSPFEHDHPACFLTAAKGLSDTARKNRQILREALEPTGLTNYPSEFWHWSYGDQGWAFRGQHAAAIYGRIMPEGWTPDPADLVEGPLERVVQNEPQPTTKWG